VSAPLLALLLGLAASGESSPVPITLDAALELAERQNPGLAAARLLQEAGEADAQAVARSTWPRLTASADLSRTDNPAAVFAQKLGRGHFGVDDFEVERLNHPEALGHLGTSLSLELPLDLSGRAGAGSQAARAQARSAAATASEARAQLRLQVLESYRQAWLARRSVGVTERALQATRSAEQAMESRVNEGTALLADLLRLRARRRQREADLAGREGEVRQADALLACALGAPAGVRYEPIDAATSPSAPGPDLAAWTERALAARASVSASDARRDAARWAATAESRTVRPDLAFYGRLQDDRWTDGGALSTTLGTSLRWTPFDPARARRLAAARAREQAAERAAQATRDQVQLEVESAFWRAHTARQRLVAAAGGAEEGQEALRVVRERRVSGLATLTDELEMEAASLAAELQEIAAASEAAVAEAALRRAAGEL
jgi:outer membrane protein